MRSLTTVDDAYIDRHFGTMRAQYERATAFSLLKGGNISLSSMKVRNVKSNLHPGKKLVVFKYKCLSKVRNVVHTEYMVFEKDGSFIPSPDSYCTCENGAFFCSHMLCFLYLMSCVQVCWLEKTLDDIVHLLPESRQIIQSTPCLIEMFLANARLKRQMAQSNRQSKRLK